MSHPNTMDIQTLISMNLTDIKLSERPEIINAAHGLFNFILHDVLSDNSDNYIFPNVTDDNKSIGQVDCNDGTQRKTLLTVCRMRLNHNDTAKGLENSLGSFFIGINWPEVPTRLGSNFAQAETFVQYCKDERKPAALSKLHEIYLKLYKESNP